MDETIPVQEVYNRVSPTPREFSVVREDAKNKCISSSVSRRPTAQLLHAHVFDGIHLHSFDGICLQRHGDDTIRVLSVHRFTGSYDILVDKNQWLLCRMVLLASAYTK